MTQSEIRNPKSEIEDGDCFGCGYPSTLDLDASLAMGAPLVLCGPCRQAVDAMLIDGPEGLAAVLACHNRRLLLIAQVMAHDGQRRRSIVSRIERLQYDHAHEEISHG